MIPNSVKEELLGHIADLIKDSVLTDENRDDWHFHAFNEDYYLTGYRQCSEWLKRHNIGEFEAAGICRQYEIENFGQNRVFDNAEIVVNMLAYIWGEELLNEIGAEDVSELLESVENF